MSSAPLPNRVPGLDFGLGGEADLIRASAMRFASDETTPRAAAIGPTNEFPADLWPKMGGLGILGVTVAVRQSSARTW